MSTGTTTSRRPSTVPKLPAWRLGVALAAAMVTVGCAGGEEVTRDSLRHARETWGRAGVRDYDLEWATSGRRNDRYAVTVRGGQVDAVESVQADGRRARLKPAEPKFYGVEGLFLTIAEEMAQREEPRPFGQPRGSKAVLRFTPDPKYGFPRHYRRDVMGAPAALAIDVLRFEPVATRAEAAE